MRGIDYKDLAERCVATFIQATAGTLGGCFRMETNFS